MRPLCIASEKIRFRIWSSRLIDALLRFLMRTVARSVLPSAVATLRSRRTPSRCRVGNVCRHISRRDPDQSSLSEVRHEVVVDSKFGHIQAPLAVHARGSRRLRSIASGNF